LARDREEEYRRLVEEIAHCTRCPLHRYRKNPVPGEGPLDARVMVVGEAPGRREDEQGRPFVGPAGQLLNRLLELAGLRRDMVYITNVVKCRPPGNRDPKEEEIEACLPYLIRQIRIIRPGLIIAVGRHAGRVLYRLAGLRWTSMTRLHGRVVEAVIEGQPVLLAVTYHPAAALYKPPIREELEKDFSGPIAEAVKKVMGGGGGERRSGQTSLLDFMR
jgi:uracil-DNA glycosylase family 4